MSNTIALGDYEGYEQVESREMDEEQNNDKKSSDRENNSQKINNSDEGVIIREEVDNGGYFDRTNYDMYNVRKDGYFFADEVKVDGETIFTIPIEKQLENEQDLPKRKSRWGDRPQRRKKAQVNHIFNPLQGLTTGNGLLSITAEGFKQGLQYPEKKEEEEEKFSRWGPEYEKTFHPPLLNHIPHTINDDDLEYIIRIFRLDEIQNKLQNKIRTIEDDEDCRSPSPAPIYNDQGKRINTRDYREQEALQKERYDLIEEAVRINPNFIPPHDFKIQKKQKKIYLPEQNSELLKQKVIGPKGQTHKRLELESGCKISIKGKGSGNGMKRVENDTNDKLHILLQGDTDEQLEKGAVLVDEILRGEERTNENNVKGGELMVIDNYLNKDFCSKCHQTGHKDYECTTKTTFTKVDLKCMYCGDKGHVSQDCKFKKDFQSRPNRDKGSDMDVHSKFEQFLNDVEGDNKLLGGYGARNNQKISNTSFITDAIEIDPNVLMIKADDNSYRNQKDSSYSSGPSGPSQNDYHGGYNNNNNNYNKYNNKESKFSRDNNNDYHNRSNNNDRYNNNRQIDAPRGPPPPINPPPTDQLIPPSFMNQNTMAPFQGLPGGPLPPNMPPPPMGYYPPPGGFPLFNPNMGGMPQMMYPPHYYQPYGFVPPVIQPQQGQNQNNQTQK